MLGLVILSKLKKISNVNENMVPKLYKGVLDNLKTGSLNEDSSVEVVIESMTVLMEQITKDMEKFTDHGYKQTARRIRTNTSALEKVNKLFRKVTV